LACENLECDYLKRDSKNDEIERTGYTMFHFVVGDTPFKDSILVCKVYKTTPMSLNTCEVRIYYSYSDNIKMNRAIIHFGIHAHLIAKSMYKDFVEKISGFIAK